MIAHLSDLNELVKIKNIIALMVKKKKKKKILLLSGTSVYRKTVSYKNIRLPSLKKKKSSDHLYSALNNTSE